MKRYQPLLVIFIVSAIAGLVTYRNEPLADHRSWMISFSGFFFLFLSTLKFWDLKGFYESFRKYDLIAKKYPLYGYIYPFLELVIALGYLSHVLPLLFGLLTALVMVVLLLGILNALIRGEQISCACLGSKLDLPLGVVSVVEALLMGVMAVLIVIHSF